MISFLQSLTVGDFVVTEVRIVVTCSGESSTGEMQEGSFGMLVMFYILFWAVLPQACSPSKSFYCAVH